MQFERAREFLSAFQAWGRESVGELDLDVSEDRYHVRERWFTTSGSDEIPLAKRNGVYLYTSLEDDIWYVGKGERECGGGIGSRSCAHLGRAIRTSEGQAEFPFHQWSDDADKDERIRESLRTGDFLIRTIRVEPGRLCSLVEVFLQSVYCAAFDDRPPLNKRLG